MSTLLPRRAVRLRAVMIAAAALALAAGLAACQPEPVGEQTPGASAMPSSSSSEPGATESPENPTEVALPTTCEELYSPAMLASLNEQNPPLNDPGVTMTSTQNVEALEILSSGIPTIRCSWGVPSESGLATNVSTIDAAQSETLLAAFANAGFACEALGDGTICRYEQSMVDLDDNIVELGEAHVVRGDVWVSTGWVGFSPTGYTEDIAEVLWG